MSFVLVTCHCLFELFGLVFSFLSKRGCGSAVKIKIVSTHSQSQNTSSNSCDSSAHIHSDMYEQGCFQFGFFLWLPVLLKTLTALLLTMARAQLNQTKIPEKNAYLIQFTATW